MLANIALFGGVIAALVGSLDLFLNDKQKDKASNQVLRLWNWIDDVKKKFSRLWSHRHDPGVGGLISLVLMLISGANLIFYLFKSSHYENLAIIITLQWLSLLLAAVMIRFTFAAPTLFAAAVRITLMVGTILVLICLVLLAIIEEPLSGPSGWNTLWLLSYLATFNLAMAAVLFWALTALPVVTLLVLSTTLFVLEFIARRLAEYHKGPIIGGGVLLAFIGGIYKALA